MTRETLLGETPLSRGATTSVPAKVLEALGFEPKPGERSKLLWTLAGGEVTVTKGTPQSDWRKTMLRKNGTAAVPRHIQEALSLKVDPDGKSGVLWVMKGDQVVVRVGTMKGVRQGGGSPRQKLLARARRKPLRSHSGDGAVS